MRLFRRSQDGPGPDDALAAFLAGQPDPQPADRFAFEVALRTPAGDRTVEIWRRLRDRRGEFRYGAAVRSADGAVTELLLMVPAGPGTAMLQTDFAVNPKRRGPLEMPTDDDAWAASLLAFIGSGGPSAQGRVEAASSGPYIRFASTTYAPQIASWRILRRLDDMDLPCAGGHIECWASVTTRLGQFDYDWMATAFGADGEIVAFAAAERMQGTHDDVFLGVFDRAGHHNLGNAQDWADERVFFPEAARVLSERLVRTVQDA